MAWVMNQPLNIYALVGCANGHEFAENATALEVELAPDELAWLDLQSDEVPL
jgi:aryl-alcohol dehydrogenase-like predicted oxidoreductase